jgi:hypothetical protein
MSSIDIPVLLNDFGRRSFVESEPVPLRIVLVQGEALSVPRTLSTVRVLSGKAWISMNGRDVLLSAGEQSDVGRSRNGSVISAVGSQALLFQLC